MALKYTVPLLFDRECGSCSTVIKKGRTAFYYTWANRYFHSRRCARRYCHHTQHNPRIERVELNV